MSFLGLSEDSLQTKDFKHVTTLEVRMLKLVCWPGILALRRIFTYLLLLLECLGL